LPPLILTSTVRLGVHDPTADEPRRDFDVLAARTGGAVSVPGGGVGPVARTDAALRLDLAQAVRARRTPASAYVSLSERIGLPLSLLGPAGPQVLIAHLLTSQSKRWVQRSTRFLNRIDLTLVFSQAQERYLRDEVGLGPERARFVFDKVDQRFFYPAERPARGDYLVSVGREQRDYATLVEALRPLRLPCVIVPGSAWSHRAMGELALPDHVTVRSGLSYSALRDLYRNARLVVVPVRAQTDYAAGVNTVLEGMACGRPVVASDTPGLSGYIEDRVDGISVPAGAADALRIAIEELWDDTQLGLILGASARETVERERTVDRFAAQIAEWVDALA
jgi:glycosyltransferase involved in cell wall biosynthesis